MGKGLPRSLKNADTSVVRVATIPFTAELEFTGAEAAAQSSTAVIGDLPEGNILFMGAVSYVSFDGTGEAELADDWNGSYTVGTTATADTTLQGGDADIISLTSVDDAASKVTPSPVRGVTATDGGEGGLIAPLLFDNTDGSLEINLNMSLDDADLTDSETATITATGTLFMSYAVLGND